MLILSFLFMVLNGYSQVVVKNQNDVYGTSLKFHNMFTKFGYWIDPSMPEMYSLTGVAAIDPRISLRVNWLGQIKEVPLIFDRKAPAVRLFHIKDGEVFPVWDWITGPVDTAGFSDQSFQQWECYYDYKLNQFVNAMGSNGYRFFPQQVERLDESFHSIGGNNISDPHDAQYIEHHEKLLMFHEYSWGPYSNMECVEAETGIVLGRFSTEPEDTIQSKIDILPCLDNRFLGSGEKEFYHTNSIDMIEWGEDSLLVATSERHTSLIRFAWFVRQVDGTYQTSPAFRLGSNSDPFNQVACLNGNINIQAGHDFRFIQKYGDSIVCSYYDNHSCGSGGKVISFTLYPREKEIVLLDSVRPMGNESLTSQGMGSARKILSADRSYNSVVNAPWCINWNAEYATPGKYDTLAPGGIVLDTFFIPESPGPDEVGAGIDILVRDQKKFGLGFASLDPASVGFTPVFSGLDLTGIKTSIQVAPVYRSNAYFPGQIKFPKQPEIQCRPISSADSVELYLTDSTFLIEMWSTGDTTQSIRVPKNLPNKKYFVRGKTDVDMRGLLYSLPFKLNDGGCITTAVIQQKTEFNLFPNPTSGLIQIKSDEKTTLQVFNSIGVLVSTQELQEGLNQIDFSSFPSGIYFLEGKSEKRIYTGKIIKN